MAGIGDVLGKMFSGIAGGPDGTHIKVWNELRPWIATLGPSAARKWLPQIAADTRCEVPVIRRNTRHDCENFGIATCDVCHRPVCLEHGRIDQHGDAICYMCVAEAMQVLPPLQRERARQGGARQQQQRRPPAGDQQRSKQSHDHPPPNQQEAAKAAAKANEAWALGVLGLKPSASWEEVQKAHRTLSAKYHPDKQRVEAKKAEAERRFKDVQRAREVMRILLGR